MKTSREWALRVSVIPCVLAVFCITACGPKEGASPGGSTAPAKGTAGKESSAALTLKGAVGYEVAQVANPGTLQVAAVYSSDPIPEPAPVEVNIDVSHCANKVFTENLIVDKGTRGLKNVVVRLEGIRRGKAPPEKAVLTNKNCAFEPHVSATMVGAKLFIRNDDPVLHTTHPYLNGKHFFNLPLPGNEAAPQGRPLPEAGTLEIKCDVHKWMNAYMIIHTNPYVEVSDKEGKLKIEGVPPGKYSYVAWHEQLGEKKGEVEISAGQTADLKLEFVAPK